MNRTLAFAFLGLVTVACGRAPEVIEAGGSGLASVSAKLPAFGKPGVDYTQMLIQFRPAGDKVWQTKKTFEVTATAEPSDETLSFAPGKYDFNIVLKKADGTVYAQAEESNTKCRWLKEQELVANQSKALALSLCETKSGVAHEAQQTATGDSSVDFTTTIVPFEETDTSTFEELPPIEAPEYGTLEASAKVKLESAKELASGHGAELTVNVVIGLAANCYLKATWYGPTRQAFDTQNSDIKKIDLQTVGKRQVQFTIDGSRYTHSLPYAAELSVSTVCGSTTENLGTVQLGKATHTDGPASATK